MLNIEKTQMYESKIIGILFMAFYLVTQLSQLKIGKYTLI